VNTFLRCKQNVDVITSWHSDVQINHHHKIASPSQLWIAIVYYRQTSKVI